MIFALLKILCCIVLVTLLVFCFFNLRMAAKLEFYRNQNIAIAPGASRFIVGNLIEIG